MDVSFLKVKMNDELIALVYTIFFLLNVADLNGNACERPYIIFDGLEQPGDRIVTQWSGRSLLKAYINNSLSVMHTLN